MSSKTFAKILKVPQRKEKGKPSCVCFTRVKFIKNTLAFFCKLVKQYKPSFSGCGYERELLL